MEQKQAVIQNKAGIHVRPAGLIIQSIMEYRGTIKVQKQDMEIVLKNPMDLLALGLVKDDEIIIKVDGPDEKGIAADLKRLFETNFDFPQKK